MYDEEIGSWTDPEDEKYGFIDPPEPDEETRNFDELEPLGYFEDPTLPPDEHCTWVGCFWCAGAAVGR